MRSNDFKRILELSKNEAHYKNPFVIDILPELDDNLKKIIKFATSDLC